MKEHAASRTAEYMALFRALESSRRPSKRLLVDSFAYYFLRPLLKVTVGLSRVPLIGATVPWLIDKTWSGAHSSGIARTRLIDDYLCASLHNGFDQIVILGAGFDYRAYWIAGIENSRVFEVDHPATLIKKREEVGHIFGALPKHVVYADMDFNHQSLRQILLEGGFNANKRSFFIWEGVTNYLIEQAVDNTLVHSDGNSTKKLYRFYLCT
jgi:methyltransferase (TIGR00027 family)